MADTSPYRWADGATSSETQNFVGVMSEAILQRELSKASKSLRRK
jgi:hypothetical protein